MTPDELRAVLARLDLTQVGAAELLGVYPQTMRRWIAGTSEIPVAAQIVLRLLDRGKITTLDVAKVLPRPAGGKSR